jgi:hypothetical protein
MALIAAGVYVDRQDLRNRPARRARVLDESNPTRTLAQALYPARPIVRPWMCLENPAG